MSSISINKQYDDNELVLLAKSGDSVALSMLIERYSNQILKQAYSFKNLNGLDNDDLYQEGMIGFVSSIYSYDEKHGASFRTYFSTVIIRKMLSFIRKLESNINNCIDISDYVDSDLLMSYQYPSPEESVIINEELNGILQFAKNNFSKKETKVFKLLLLGISYAEIADILDCDVKSVDNTVQRIRRKVRDFQSDK